MRHRPSRTGLLALAASALLVVAAPQAAPLRPTLRVIAPSPARILGLNFKATERVRLTGELSGVAIARTATTNAAGTFVATFLQVRLVGCHGGGLVGAVGSKGSRATLKLLPRLCSELAP